MASTKRYQKQMPFGRVADDDLSSLPFGVLRIIVDPGKRISEDRYSLLKGNAVPTPVGRRFRCIPGETNFHAALGYSHWQRFVSAMWPPPPRIPQTTDGNRPLFG